MGERLGHVSRRLLALRFLLWRFADQFADRVRGGKSRLFSTTTALIRLPFNILSRVVDKIHLLLSPWIPSQRKRMQRRLEDIQYKPEPVISMPYGRGEDSSRDGRFPRHVNRFTTAIVTTGVLIAVGYLTGQVGDLNNGDPVAGAISEQIVQTETPSPTPTNTPTVTPTETPTPSPTVVPSSTPTPTQTPEPTPIVEIVTESGDMPIGAGGIAFEMRRKGNSDIYALTLGLDDPVRLTSHRAEDCDPAWSPDGRYVAFSSHRDGNWEIYVLDLLSGELTRLTENLAYDGAPSWSPDSQWLVYESYQGENMDLYLIQADGNGSPVRLTEHPAHDFSPAWSPRGRHIAFTSWRSGNKDIFVMSLNALSDTNAMNITASPGAFEDDPAFSPDGQYLAYYDDSDGYELIYAVQLEDDHPSGSEQSVGQGRHPSWSPNSNNLVYVHQNYDQYYLIASSLDAWNTAPQVFVSDVPLSKAAWSAIDLPAQLNERIGHKAPEKDEPLFTERVTIREESEPAYLLFEVDVDAPAPYLNDRVDDSFKGLRQRVIEEVGWDFLGRVDNMYDALAAGPLPGETSQSWNKAGRAFDFYYRYPISVDPQVEIVREDQGNDTYWRVYLKTALQDGSQGEPLRQRPWDFQARYGEDPLYYDQGGKWKEEPPAGYYFDFTALAEDYGWSRVPAAQNWRSYFQGIRYWHFENQQGLTWEEALLEIFTSDELSMVYGDQ